MTERETEETLFEAQRLRGEGKSLTANGGIPLEDVLEENLFREANARINAELRRRRVVKVHEANKRTMGGR